MEIEAGSLLWQNLAVTMFKANAPNELMRMRFWESLGPGYVSSGIDRPVERSRAYESLLTALELADPEKYAVVSKGTPFYFLGWLSFDARNYEQATFYMDAAMAEDEHHNPDGFEKQPAAEFVLLDPKHGSASHLVRRVRRVLESQLSRFNQHTGDGDVTVTDVVDGMVRQLLMSDSGRSVVTAFYAYLLEFEDRHLEATLRSHHGGTIQPFLLHIFKGALIFESLLKQAYPMASNGTLGSVRDGPRISDRLLRWVRAFNGEGRNHDETTEVFC